MPDFPVRGCLSPGVYRLSVEANTGSLEVLMCRQRIDAGGGVNAGNHVELDISIFPVKSESPSSSIETVAKRIRKISNESIGLTSQKC